MEVKSIENQDELVRIGQPLQKRKTFAQFTSINRGRGEIMGDFLAKMRENSARM